MRKFSIILLVFIIFNIVNYSYANTNLVYDKRWTIKYDRYFKKWSKRFFGINFDWHWWKAQSIAESALNPNAKSWVSAKGLMQLMPLTYNDIQKKIPNLSDNPYDPESNIMAGIYYNNYLYMNWSAKRSELDRLALVFASYNGGLKNVLNAQQLCLDNSNLNCNMWNNIRIYADQVNTWKSEESLLYVRKIFSLMGY